MRILSVMCNVKALNGECPLALLTKSWQALQCLGVLRHVMIIFNHNHMVLALSINQVSHTETKLLTTLIQTFNIVYNSEPIIATWLVEYSKIKHSALLWSTRSDVLSAVMI